MDLDGVLDRARKGGASRQDMEALLALHYMPAGRADVREIIRPSLLSDWERVRDSAAIAAQRCYGRSGRDVVTGGPSQRLIERVGEDILNWIWPERRTPKEMRTAE